MGPSKKLLEMRIEDGILICPMLEKDRRVTQGELEHMRDILEGEIAGLKEELRSMVSQALLILKRGLQIDRDS